MHQLSLKLYRLSISIFLYGVCCSGCQNISPTTTNAPLVESLFFPYPAGRPSFGASPNSAPENSDLFQVSDHGDDAAKYELLAEPELSARETERPRFGARSTTEWRAAKSLMTLRSQLAQLAPNRDKRDDGMVGDNAHWLRGKKSDHNPWVNGVVTAYDVTNSPSTGCSVQILVDSLVQSRDARIKYIIWNHRIINSDRVGGVAAWTWRRYTGRNPHDKHMHLSVLPSQDLYDRQSLWNIKTK